MNRELFKNVIEDQQAEALEVTQDKSLTPRSQLKLLLEFLPTSLVKVIMGVRRSGKSTLALQAMGGSRYLYFNFDDEILSQIPVHKLQLLLEIGLELVPKPDYLIFDEIQNIEGWELFINKMHRKKKNIILTGSNSRLLSSELSTHLTGRHLSLELLPFSFNEYLDYQLKSPQARPLKTEDRLLLKSEFVQYLEMGGFPDLQKIPFKTRVAQHYLKELYDRVINRDLIQRQKIRNIKVLKELSLLLMSQASSRFTYQSLKRALAINSINTVKNYVGYIQESYIGFVLEPFSHKIKERISLPKKFYSIDTALTQAIIGSGSFDYGKRLENVIYLELRRRGLDFYYIYQSGFEVDFLIKEHRKIKELIQVSWDISNTETRTREIKSLLAADREFRVDQLTIITHQSNAEEIKVEGKTIDVIPAWQWLLKKNQD